MSETILPKISIKTIGAAPAKHSLAEGQHYPVAHIFGTTTKVETVETAYGESTRFVGNFEAVNVQTGEAFRSTKCFLPAIIADMLGEAAIDSEAPVDFALEIGVQYSEKGNTGFSYTVKPLVEMAPNDALAHLREASQKALPAPAQESEPGNSDAAPSGKGKAKK